MIKYTIPSVLTGVILMAGIFAFMPIDQASTVHDTIQATSVKIVEVNTTAAGFDINSDDELRITSDRPFSVIGINCVEVDTGNAENMAVWTSRIQGATASLAFTGALPAVAADPIIVAGGQITHQILDDVDVGFYAAAADQFIVFDLGTMDDIGSGDEDIDCSVQVLTSGDSTTVTALWVAV